MLLDNKERFVELCVENMLWGNLILDFTHAREDQCLKNQLVNLSGELGKWIRLRENKESDEFKRSTQELYPELLGARFSSSLQGKLRDREEENELRKLQEENLKLKTDNIKAVKELTQTKEELDLLKSGKPIDKDFKGFS